MKSYVMVTGATGAIGSEIVRALLQKGENVLLACRNMEKAEVVRGRLLKEIPSAVAMCVELDLADESSVKNCVENIRNLHISIKGLINNAGVMNRHYSVDAQGRELTMAVNYHNTRLLTLLLLDAFPELSRVVFTSSLTRYMYGRKVDLEVDKSRFHQLRTYGLSKRAITDFALRLSREGRCGLKVNCADPGVVDSNMITMSRWYDSLADILFRPFIRSPRKGAVPALRAYYSPESPLIYCLHRTHKM